MLFIVKAHNVAKIYFKVGIVTYFQPVYVKTLSWRFRVFKGSNFMTPDESIFYIDSASKAK